MAVIKRSSVDATQVRVKNSRSQTISWFPLVDHFEQIVRGWAKELLKIGARNEDALFPPDCALTATTYLNARMESRLDQYIKAYPFHPTLCANQCYC
jgi:hypothetical protein